MKRTTILYTTLFVYFVLSLITFVTSEKLMKKKCKYYSPKRKWTDSAQYCGNIKNNPIFTLEDCKKTNVYKPLLGYTWFYCYPDKSKEDVYYRIELRACIGFNETTKSLEKGTKYNNACTQPKLYEPFKTRFTFETKCTYKNSKTKIIKFDVNDYIKVKDGLLYCRD